MKRAVPLFSFIGGILLFVCGLGALGGAFWLREEPLPDGFSWKPPLEQVDPDRLGPATLILPLTGLADPEILGAALDQGEWDNAFALIAYDPNLDDPTRIGVLLQLGGRYAASRRALPAARCYQAAARIATLSPFLSDRVRADTYLQAGAGLRSLGAREAARMAVDQAYLVAQFSPTLRRDPGAMRLTQVANAYAALGADALAEQARAKSNEVVTVQPDEVALLPREPFVIPAATLPPSPEVDEATLVRQAAARQLQSDLIANPPRRAQDWPSDSMAQLRDALIQEDGVRTAYYEQATRGGLSVPVQVALLKDRVNWLATKARVARGAFGAALVPDWQREAAAHQQALSDAWGDLFRLYESQAAAIPNGQAVSQATEDVLRQELFAIRWGWYQGASEQDLHSQLADVSRQLQEASILSLRLDSLTVGNRMTDLLLPDDLYGQNQGALPR